MAKNSTVRLGNVPFSANSNTRYKQSKTATFSKTFNGCTYIRLSGSVRLETTPSEVSGYNFIEIDEGDGMTVRGFITGIEYINERTTRIDFKIDGWETFKSSVVFKKSYIERLSCGTGASNILHTIPEPFLSDDIISYADTQYDISGYKYIIATLHPASVDIYNDIIALNSIKYGFQHIVIDNKAIGTMLSGVWHGCIFIVCDTIDEAQKITAALVSTGYESSILNVFAVPEDLITANGTKTQEISYRLMSALGVVTETKTSSCTILNHSNITLLLSTITAPALTCSDKCKYQKIKNPPYTILRVTCPDGQTVDYDYNDFADSPPKFGVYGAIGTNSELMLVPLNYQGIQYNFHSAIVVSCNQTGMYSGSAFNAWLTSSNLKYISSSINGMVSGIASGLSGNMSGMASSIVSSGLSAFNRNDDIIINSKKSTTIGNNSNSSFALCHPQSSCFKLSCMSLKPVDAENLSAYIDNFGYVVSKFDVPNTEIIEEDVYIKCNNVQLNVNCPDNYASEIRNLFNGGCRFV